MSNQEPKEFEFLLTIDGNIIVQRLFNVRGFNPNVKKSLDLYHTTNSICARIEDDMKEKTLEYMTENQDYLTSDEYQEYTTTGKKEDFILEIKSGDEVFIKSAFPAFVYHPKVRVDIRHMLKDFQYELVETLSSKLLEETYLGKDLEVNYLGKE